MIQDLNVERGVLASLFYQISERYILDELKDEYFTIGTYKKLLVYFKGNTEWFDSEIERILGEFEFKNLINTSGAIKVENYISKLQELANKRKLESIALALQRGVNASDVKSLASKVINECSDILKEGDKHSLKNARTSVGEFREYTSEMEKRSDKGMLGIASGLNSLDDKTKGFKKGELCILAARPGMGKTTLALNIFDNAISANEAVLFISLEMSSLQLIQRMVASRCRTPLGTLTLGSLSQREFNEMEKACEFYMGKAFNIYDKGSLTLASLNGILRGLKARDKLPSFVIIDYLSLMQGGAKQSRYEAVSDISRGLKSLAMELSIPILALAQLNRQIELRKDQTPQLSDLRESGSIEQDADTVLFIHNDRKNNVDDYKLIVAKNRHGEGGEISLGFDKAYAKMYSKGSLQTNTFYFQEN